MYANTIPMLINNINALSKFLKKAEAQCDARKFDKSVVLASRLFPDMFALSRQVMLVTDFAKGCGARLAGIAVPAYADDEKTFEDLQARLTKCTDFLSTITSAQLEGAEKRSVTIKIGGEDRTMSGQDYFNSMALPNFFFHMTTAYNILRHNGIEIGKGDFMGRG